MTREAFDLTSALRPRLPSPLQPVEDERFARHGVRLLLKRDDLIHPDIPGNKWRKLVPNLHAAAGRPLLTFGGAYSNHLRATAAAGRLLGFTTIGIVRGDELASRPLNPSLSRCAADGMHLHFVDRAAYRGKDDPEVRERILTAAAQALEQRWARDAADGGGWSPQDRHPSAPVGPALEHAHRAGPTADGAHGCPQGPGGPAHGSGRGGPGDIYVVPEGGSNALAAHGCTALGHELRDATDVVAVACGTGGTIAGLAAGLGPGRRAIGFPVLKGGFLGDSIRTLQLEAFGGPVGNWALDGRFHFGGYARTTPRLDAFAADFEARHGLPVERVYVAKMLYGLTVLAAEGVFPPGTTIAAVITGQGASSR
ncbi:1-aminocyclopropane-1-carboxylate deaminase/D-cysteine desulfhydrase [Streptomyces sp. NBC_01794]|uniref:1-aminocyclopropane-1-carboxylate deaminase/D-cysteine desulfhydrase n=1 Tax=Streptomyces sp. NBC_01794 TaxID=2975942 RepID=UPI00308A4751|nr:pyridoxal-phosphate dependent enzyme [Streptomyces sp. NBC_01794]